MDHKMEAKDRKYQVLPGDVPESDPDLLSDTDSEKDPEDGINEGGPVEGAKEDPFAEFAVAADWSNPRHYKPSDGAGLYLVHWRSCPFCRDAIDDPVFTFFTYRPMLSIQELAEFARLWPLLIADMTANFEPIGPI